MDKELEKELQKIIDKIADKYCVNQEFVWEKIRTGWLINKNVKIQ